MPESYIFQSFNGLQRQNFYDFSVVFFTFGADFAFSPQRRGEKEDAKHVGVLFKSLRRRRRQFLVSRETILSRISLLPHAAVDGLAPLRREGTP